MEEIMHILAANQFARLHDLPPTCGALLENCHEQTLLDTCAKEIRNVELDNSIRSNWKFYKGTIRIGSFLRC